MSFLARWRGRSDLPALDLETVGAPVSLSAVGALEAEIHPARATELFDVRVFDNMFPYLREAWEGAYAARTAHADPVGLYRLPKGALLSGPSGSHVLAGGKLLSEQVNPTGEEDLLAVLQCFAPTSEPINIRRETVLITRYGDATWGHWLVELLTKIVVCERHAPGRFMYAVSATCMDQLGHVSQRLRESIAFYGVSQDRLLYIRNDRNYRFSRLFALSPVFSDFILHPTVAALMGDQAIKSQAQAYPTKIALRREGSRRIYNNAEVEALLIDHGFVMVDIANLTFEQQVRTFKSATTIFSVLGSGLSGLILSPPGVRVVTAWPEIWGDRFFYNVVQTRPNARWAEVRGPVVEEDPVLYHNSSFHVPMDVLQAALAAVQAP